MDKKRFVIVILISLVLAAPCAEASAQWEQVRTEAVSDLVGADRVEVTASEGYIYVTAPRPVTVKVFSIVGQLISEKKLPAGTSRLRMETRGIYIVRAGEVAIRVTI